MRRDFHRAGELGRLVRVSYNFEVVEIPIL
jgi:hypothetical protein